ncbi:MAG: hypothetical protein HJJLKODD_00886 [Phycisphaerae bacterium]|nr:hypothetical protein [Phycisphaerae bacterium]
MQLKKVYSLGLCLLGVLISLTGCGGDSPAAITSGGGSNPLDGAVLSDDGVNFTMELTDDGRNLETITGSDGSVVGFDAELSNSTGVAVVNRLTTPSAYEAVFSADRGEVTISGNFPFAGEQTFTTNVGDAFGRILGDEAARIILQDETDCSQIVTGMDTFCDLYWANRDAALDEVIALARQAAADAGIPEIAFGVVDGIITDFFDVLDNVCGAWTQLRQGTESTPAVDPCDL